MPFYDYKCEKCQKVFEKFHGISETPQVLCPDCGGEAGKMISSSIGIAFKGSGFHVNDYKSSSSGTASKPSCCSSGTCNHASNN